MTLVTRDGQRVSGEKKNEDAFSIQIATADGRLRGFLKSELRDIVRGRLALQAPLFVDPYDAVRATGSFILIDEATNRTVAAGMVQ